MTSQPHSSAPSEVSEKPTLPAPNRIGKLKLAFLYVLIGGLAASSLTAIVSLLIGEFNSEIQKSLLTIFIFFSHSLFILALLWADRDNQVGRIVLPTTIFVLALANMVTSTLSTWEIISTETAWRALGLYMLIIGAVFIITGILKLRIRHQATTISLYTTIGSITALIIALTPWVLAVIPEFNPFYFRLVAALSIFSSTAFLIAIILRGIALARHPELKATISPSKPVAGGLLAIYITVGTIAAMVWSAGFLGFLISAVEAGQPDYEQSNSTYYN